MKCLVAASLIAVQLEPTNAITLREGETVRACYAMTGSDLQPVGHFVQFGAGALDPVEVFSISSFGSGLDLLGYTRVSLGASQTTSRSSIFLNLDRDDFSPSIEHLDAVRIPDAVSIVFTAMTGSYDLSATTLTAFDRVTLSFPLTLGRLTDFTESRDAPAISGAVILKEDDQWIATTSR